MGPGGNDGAAIARLEVSERGKRRGMRTRTGRAGGRGGLQGAGRCGISGVAHTRRRSVAAKSERVTIVPAANDLGASLKM